MIMDRITEWFESNLPIFITLLVFIIIAMSLPVMTLGSIPRPEAIPHFIAPREFYLFLDNHYLQTNLGVNIQYLPLMILIGIMVLQMIWPNNDRLDLFYDIGINLLISAGVLLTWTAVNYQTLLLLSDWAPQMSIYQPVVGMIIVQFQRCLMYILRKRKNDHAPNN